MLRVTTNDLVAPNSTAGLVAAAASAGNRIDPTLNPVPKPAPLREGRRFDHARYKVTPIP